MGRRGPPKEPTALTVYKGNPGKRALNRAEPVPDSLVKPATPPRHLSDAAKKEWKRIEPQLRAMKILTTADLSALEAYCVCWGDWQACVAFVREHGSVIMSRDDKGVLKFAQPVPQFGMAMKLLEKVRQYQREFGLTPSSRAGIRVETPEKPAGTGGLSKPKVS